MILKRYVKYGDGTILDYKGKKLSPEAVDFILSIDDFETTADEIWELMGKDIWLCILIGGQKEFIKDFNRFAIIYKGMAEPFKKSTVDCPYKNSFIYIDEITELFAPITENGEVIRYERVWKK